MRLIRNFLVSKPQSLRRLGFFYLRKAVAIRVTFLHELSLVEIETFKFSFIFNGFRFGTRKACKSFVVKQNHLTKG
jgi:hypothetical protein